MPRFTKKPSASSSAARRTMRSRGADLRGGPEVSARTSPRCGCATVRCSMRFSYSRPTEAVDEDAGRVHLVGIEHAGRHDLLDLRDRDFAAVAIIGLKLRAVCRKTRLPSVVAAHALISAKSAVSASRARRSVRRSRASPSSATPSHAAVGRVELRQAAFAHLRADAGRREEGRDAGAAGADALGERCPAAPSSTSSRPSGIAARSSAFSPT
jgi:hypothetical protein